jgi:hypothetical protein
MTSIAIAYNFQLQDGSEENFQLQLESRTLKIIQPPMHPLPNWTLLSNCRCANCPLEPAAVSHCPAAVCMSGWLERFARLLSCGQSTLKVKTPERLINGLITTQKGVASLMRLLIVVSGCPRASFMKPLARFHMPFGDDAESVWQASAAYLLVQYFRERDGSPSNTDLKEVWGLFRDLQEAHLGFVDRLCCHDAAMRCGSELPGVFAKGIPMVNEDFFDQIRQLFAPYLCGTGCAGM